MSRILDEYGLGHLLMMNGYPADKVYAVKNLIRDEVSEISKLVFCEILKEDLPKEIDIQLWQNKDDEDARLACFMAGSSSRDKFVFVVFEIAVRHVLDNGIEDVLHSTLIHEMIHAADWSKLDAYCDMLENISNKIDDYYAGAGYGYGLGNSLYDSLNILQHYRAEGVAILSEQLLSRRHEAAFFDGNKLSEKVKRIAVFTGYLAICYDREIRNDLYQRLHDYAYYNVADGEKSTYIASSILLKVLYTNKSIDFDLYEKAQKGCLSDEEAYIIVRASLSLSLSAYIEGLVAFNNGCDLIPIRKFLDFCGNFQDEVDESYIANFTKMVSRPKMNAKSFIDFVGRIMGSPMSDNELQVEYKNFFNSVDTYSKYPELVQKVENLYEVLLNNESREYKNVARWALTYIFDEYDVIHDEVPIFGYVDDMIIADIALKLFAEKK